MKKLRKLLTIATALGFSTVTTVNVVACSYSSNPGKDIEMNLQVQKNLGLGSSSGGQPLDFNTVTETEKEVSYRMSAINKKVKASLLLDSNNKAKDQESYEFITKTLKIEPTTTGPTFSDSVFDKSILEAIQGNVTDIKPIFTKTSDNKDYAVTGGTFKFQFKDNNGSGEPLGENYTINLKPKPNTGIISSTLGLIVRNFKVVDTDVVANESIKFENGVKIPSSAVKGTIINIISSGNSNWPKLFNSLNNLTGLKITAQFESTSPSITPGTGTWQVGNQLIISYKTNDVNFDSNLVQSRLEVR